MDLVQPKMMMKLETSEALTCACLSLGLACVFVTSAVYRRWRALKSPDVHTYWGRPKASRVTQELERALLDDDDDDDEEWYLVKSRAPLACRQLMYGALVMFHGVAMAWHRRNLDRAAVDLVFCVAWFLIYLGEGIDHAYVRLRAEPKPVNALIAVVAVVSGVGVAFDLGLSSKNATAKLLFLDVNLTPMAFWLNVFVFCSATFWRRAALKSARRSRRPPTAEEVALQLHEIVSFSWLTPTLMLSKKKVLALKDLPATSGDDSSEELWKRFERIFGDEMQRPRPKNSKKKRRIWLQLLRLVWPQFSAFAAFAVASVVFTYVQVDASAEINISRQLHFFIFGPRLIILVETTKFYDIFFGFFYIFLLYFDFVGFRIFGFIFY